jgi:hypothetical protein
LTRRDVFEGGKDLNVKKVHPNDFRIVEPQSRGDEGGHANEYTLFVKEGYKGFSRYTHEERRAPLKGALHGA